MAARPRRCPNCEFSYAWDGEFCGHCQRPYPRRSAWFACTEPHWFCRHHEADLRQLAMFGCACIRAGDRWLPADALPLIEALESAASAARLPLTRANPRARVPLSAITQLRVNAQDTVPATSPTRAVIDALAELAQAGLGSDHHPYYQVAYLVGTAHGLAAVPETAEERIARPAFLDDPVRNQNPVFRQSLLYGSMPHPLTAQEEAEWNQWRLATSGAERTRRERMEASRQGTASLCDLYRDIVPYPFEPLAFDASWRTSTAVALARNIHESRDFSSMPILADALQDAGCEDEHILEHCRGGSRHVLGCWVIGMVLHGSS